MIQQYDKIIIGAGLYGLYAAHKCGLRGETVLVLEYDDAAFKRATYINQARVHMGYHYPRSLTTATKAAKYFNRFTKDYNFSILNTFNQVYGVSSDFSWINAKQFKDFCAAAEIECEEVLANNYFKSGYCDGAFLTKEYTYDAQLLKNYFVEQINRLHNVKIIYGSRIDNIEKYGDNYLIGCTDAKIKYASPFVLNATYASVNQILQKTNSEYFKIKYELCEIVLCEVNDKLNNLGLTVMDGPFFSIMPFGKTGYHSLTSVTFTPHTDSKTTLPHFTCQKKSNGFCSPDQLGNCNDCAVRPNSAWPYMSRLTKKYLRDDLHFNYVKSLFSVKPILLTSEIDDSRPTIIQKHSTQPTFISVLSGKINMIYDLDSIL